MKKIYFLAAATLLMLTACDNDNSGDTPEEGPSSTGLRISASIEEACLTRAEDGAWSKDDRIGIITTVGALAPESFHPYVNLGYTADNDGTLTTFSGPEMLFYNHLTISGYHPYRGSEGTAPGEADGYLIRTDTRIDKQFGHNGAIDFLHATRTGIKLADAKEVELAFAHKMTKLTFTFLSNADKKNTVEVAKLAMYRIEGLVMDGSFDTLTGECIADSGKGAEDLVVEGLYIPVEERDQSHTVREMKPLIVFPQSPTGDVVLRVYLDEAQLGNADDYQVYSCTIKFGEKMLKPGYHYNFKVNVTKAGLQLGGITIAGWGEGVKSTLIATIDGEEPEFDPNEED